MAEVVSHHRNRANTSIQVHVLSRLSRILFAAAAELLDIVAFAKWAGYVCGKPPALFVSSGPIFEPVHRGQIFDMSLPAEYLLYTAPLSGVAAY